jgi:protein-tyrosine kinase
VDAARLYGDSELVLGQFLRGRRSDRLVGIDVRSTLGTGTPTDHASELLASARMAQIGAQICANPRYLVVIDSAPVLLSSEVGALAQLVGQIILVARSGKTPRQALLDGIGQLDGSKLSGIVLNDSKADPRGYYSGYGSYGTQGQDSASAG